MRSVVLLFILIGIVSCELYGIGWNQGNSRLLTFAGNYVLVVKAIAPQTNPILGVSTYCAKQKLHYSLTSNGATTTVERRNLNLTTTSADSKSFSTLFTSMSCDSDGKVYSLRQDSSNPSTLKLAQVDIDQSGTGLFEITSFPNYPRAAIGLAAIGKVGSTPVYFTVVGNDTSMSIVGFDLSGVSSTPLISVSFNTSLSVASISKLWYDNDTSVIYFSAFYNGANSVFSLTVSTQTISLMYTLDSNLAVVKYGSFYDDVVNVFYVLSVHMVTGYQVFGQINVSNPNAAEFNIITNPSYVYDFFVDSTIAPVPIPSPTPSVTTAPIGNSLTSSSNSGDSSLYMYVGIAVGVVVLCCIVLIVIVVLVRKRKSNNNNTNTSSYKKSEKAPIKEVQIELKDAPTQYESISQVQQAAASQLAFQQRTSSQQRMSGNSTRPMASMQTQSGVFGVDYNELQIQGQIGVGSYGVVEKASWRGVFVAVKRMINYSETEAHALVGEAQLMQQIQHHPNVCQVIGLCENPLCLITEFMAGGNLWTYVTTQYQIPDFQYGIWVRGTSAGITHLHKSGVIHRDVAARNVLLDEHLNPKISDFGLSRAVQFDANEMGSNQSGSTKSDVGPLKWMSPESLMSKQYSEKSDAWSFGVMLFEISMKTEPYGSNLDPISAASKVVTKQLSLLDFVQESAVHPTIMKLMSMCLQNDPSLRPSFTDIYNISSSEF